MTKKPTISKKPSLWITGSVAFLVIICSFFLNGFLEGIVKDYLGRELDRINKSDRYQLTVSDIELNIFRGNLSLIGTSGEPTEKYERLFEAGQTDEMVLKELFISRADIKGLSLFNFLWDKDLDIKAFHIDEITFNLYRPRKLMVLEGIEEKEKSSFSLNTLQLPGITSVDLSQITIDNYQLNIIDKSVQDTLSSYKGDQLLLSGIVLNPPKGDNPYFVVDDSKLELDLSNQQYYLPKGNYVISFDSFNFNSETEKLSLRNFTLKPSASRDDFARRNTFTYEIFDIEINEFELHGAKTSTYIESGAISLDSIAIDGLDMAIYKDKRKPFNTSKHKLLPNEQLKRTDQPLHIKKVSVSNSQLSYAELLPKGDKTMELELTNIDAAVNYITSVKDSMLANRSLQVELRASLQDAIPLNVGITMPYDSQNNAFTLSGNTRETSSFRELNSIVSAALGIEFTGGQLHGMEFNARGTPHAIKGDLAMYYTDLEIKVENKNHKEKKALNWLANTVVKSSNPNKKGVLIVGSMENEREYYKGMPNFIWKSIQSGIVNSFNPAGKRKKRK